MSDRWAISNRPIALLDQDPPLIGSVSASQNMHEGRFAGPIVADKAQAFADAEGEVDPSKSTDGAEFLFDAVHADDLNFF
jgi:hypothetical protein